MRVRVVGAVVSVVLIALFAPGTSLAGDPADYDACQIGKYNPTTNRFYLDLNGNGAWDGNPTDANFGYTGGVADAVLANDWNDDGEDGIAKDVNGTYLVDIDENRASGGSDLNSTFSPGEGTLMSGRWNSPASLGKYLASDRFRLDLNDNGVYDAGTDADFVLYSALGQADAVLSGKWGGKPHDSVAKFYNTGNRFIIDKNQNRRWDGNNDVDAPDVGSGPIGFIGGSNDINKKFAVFAGQGIPIKGNWDGSDDDSEEIGIYVASVDTFYLDLNGNGIWEGSGVDQVGSVAKFAGAGIPVVCNFTGTAFDLIGKYVQSEGRFYLDGGNFTWDGNGNSGDRNNAFATFDDAGTEVPVLGIWVIP